VPLSSTTSPFDEFSNRIVHSGLIDEISAHEAISDWRLAATVPDDVQHFAAWLVENNMLTPLQAENVLAAVIQRTQLDQYHLGEQVAKGQLGDVFTAVDTETGQTVCLKVFRHELRVDQEQIARIHREASVSVQAIHPHLVKTLGVGRNHNTTWLVLEPLVGETLASRLGRETWLPIGEACRLIRQAALGLAHLHSMGTIHRDINPGCLWITSDGTVKLLEFGSTLDELEYLDRSGDSEGVTTLSGSIIGTFDYMPPEQALDSHSATERSDVYALGCVLYHCLTGQPPFPDSHPVRQMMRHTREPPRPLEELRQNIPYTLDLSTRTMLAKRPEDRIETAADVAELLAEFADPDTLVYPTGSHSPGSAVESSTRQNVPTEHIFRTDHVDGELVARFKDDKAFQTGSINETLDSLSDLIDSAEGRTIVLDFADVAFLGSPALGMLVSVRKYAESAGSTLRLRGLIPVIREVFRVIRFDRLFVIEDDDDDVTPST
jgi:serine/threonine-protein kinase